MAGKNTAVAGAATGGLLAALAGFGDDCARLAGRTATGLGDDVGRLGARGAAAGLGDDVARLGAGFGRQAPGLGEEVARLGAGAGDDVGRGLGRAGGAADDLAGPLGRATGVGDDVVGRLGQSGAAIGHDISRASSWERYGELAREALPDLLEATAEGLGDLLEDDGDGRPAASANGAPTAGLSPHVARQLAELIPRQPGLALLPPPGLTLAGLRAGLVILNAPSDLGRALLLQGRPFMLLGQRGTSADTLRAPDGTDVPVAMLLRSGRAAGGPCLVVACGRPEDLLSVQRRLLSARPAAAASRQTSQAAALRAAGIMLAKVEGAVIYRLVRRDGKEHLLQLTRPR